MNEWEVRNFVDRDHLLKGLAHWENLGFEIFSIEQNVAPNTGYRVYMKKPLVVEVHEPTIEI